MSADSLTATLRRVGSLDEFVLPRAAVRAVAPNGKVLQRELTLGRVVLGRADTADLQLDDPGVSNHHCEVVREQNRVLLRDLGSKNGTLLSSIPIIEAPFLKGQRAVIGGTTVTLELLDEAPKVLPISPKSSFGGAVGQSLPMRLVFGQLERLAQSDVALLLLGEPGTGKELLAQAVHENSARAEKPFVVVDCRTLNAELVETELFGHEAGAFTSASTMRRGLLEQVSGGTLFIDAVTELPLSLQPKLLRALETHRFRRVGGNNELPLDARVVSSAGPDVRQQLKEGNLRSDLYFRLAVTELVVPPLRERREDIPPLVERLLSVGEPPRSWRQLAPSVRTLLTAHPWPGNVRELKNVVARLLLFPEEESPLLPGSVGGLDDYRGLALAVAREAALERFERAYLTAALKSCGGSIPRAAKQLGVSRQYLHRLAVKYELQDGAVEP